MFYAIIIEVVVVGGGRWYVAQHPDFRAGCCWLCTDFGGHLQALRFGDLRYLILLLTHDLLVQISIWLRRMGASTMGTSVITIPRSTPGFRNQRVRDTSQCEDYELK